MNDRETAAVGGSLSLVRDLSQVDAAMIVVGSMIGSGVFITSAESARLGGLGLSSERSDSSASTTSHSPAPQPALNPVERTAPPTR